MHRKVKFGRTMPLSEFKTNPSAALHEAEGDAIAVTSDNKVQFYAVPSQLFEDMTEFCEVAQRGTMKMKDLPPQATGDAMDMEKVTRKMAKKLKDSKPKDIGGFEEE
ncbi:hypothetical protein ACJJIL_21410 [Microbulbifer sp. EKSA005]|uniref:hypothetical protein n=1 Tax=Microbulbifer sp. EKSA005 TaxID=3243364 RepID=UPI00404177DF